MSEVALMVFLLLEDVKSIFASLDQVRNVEDIVFPFFLIVRRVWYLEFWMRLSIN